jgi:hypothetical protein
MDQSRALPERPIGLRNGATSVAATHTSPVSQVSTGDSMSTLATAVRWPLRSETIAVALGGREVASGWMAHCP